MYVRLQGIDGLYMYKKSLWKRQVTNGFDDYLKV